MSKQNDENSPTGEQSRSINRRGFVQSLGAAGGAVALGSFGVSNVSATKKIQADEVRGWKRGQLIREANSSSGVKYVAEKLGKRGGVHSVFKYTLENGSTAFGVSYGAGDQSKGATINYYTSDSFDDGPAVTGGKPVGNGIMNVVADDEVVLESAGTPRANAAIESLQQNSEYNQLKDSLDDESVREDKIVLAHTASGTQEKTDILIPVAKAGKTAGRVILSGPEWPNSENIQSYSTSSSTFENVQSFSVSSTTTTDDSPVLGEESTCGTICGALALGGFGACTAACLDDPLTWEFAISGECGELCTAVVEGSCVPTCKSL